MSTTIRATCPTCGDVVLSAAQVVATAAPALGWNRYVFTCPTCADLVEKPADDDVIVLLVGAGVRVDVLDFPAEMLEPKWGPPILYDDVLDFALLLSRADDLVTLASAGLPSR